MNNGEEDSECSEVDCSPKEIQDNSGHKDYKALTSRGEKEEKTVEMRKASKFYTETEKRQIINEMLRVRGGIKYMGVKFWKNLEPKTERSWQSLKEHFVKHMLPCLENIDISEDDLCKLKKKLEKRNDDNMEYEDDDNSDGEEVLEVDQDETLKVSESDMEDNNPILNFYTKPALSFGLQNAMAMENSNQTTKPRTAGYKRSSKDYDAAYRRPNKKVSDEKMKEPVSSPIIVSPNMVSGKSVKTEKRLISTCNYKRIQTGEPRAHHSSRSKLSDQESSHSTHSSVPKKVQGYTPEVEQKGLVEAVQLKSQHSNQTLTSEKREKQYNGRSANKLNNTQGTPNLDHPEGVARSMQLKIAAGQRCVEEVVTELSSNNRRVREVAESAMLSFIEARNHIRLLKNAGTE